MENFNSHTQCLICNAKTLNTLTGYELHYLVKCNDCNFVFSRRIPSHAELESHYRHYSYAGETKLSSITEMRYLELLNKFVRYNKLNRLLDVGCGAGFFLTVAKKLGWDVYGTEFSPTALQLCENQGIEMKLGQLNPNNYEPESFDIITSFEVIEHINNPQIEIANMLKLLRPGGLLYITTPNFNAIERFLLKANYNIIAYPEHLSYYTPSTIQKLMSQFPVKKLKIETTGISFDRIRASRVSSKANHNLSQVSDNPQNQVVASSDEQLRQNIESSKILQLTKKLINSFLTCAGTGMALKAWFEKNTR